MSDLSPESLLEKSSRETLELYLPDLGEISTDDGFADFWNHFPRKVAKKNAERAYGRALKAGTCAADLLAGAMRYAAERSGQDPKFTKHPATWLNSGGWEDESAPARLPQTQSAMTAAEFAARRAQAIQSGEWA